MKKLYLDVCTLCRPFDNQNLMRIRLETDAYYLILNNIQKQKYEMIVSPVHYREIEDISDVIEKVQILHLLTVYGKEPNFDLKKGRERADELLSLNFGIADAAHLSFAEQSADYLITCDDKFLKQSKRANLKIEVINPIEFCIKEELK